MYKICLLLIHLTNTTVPNTAKVHCNTTILHSKAVHHFKRKKKETIFNFIRLHPRMMIQAHNSSFELPLRGVHWSGTHTVKYTPFLYKWIPLVGAGDDRV